MYYIYILFSLKTNKYYIGSTDDLQRRLKHHNAGSTPSTKAGAPDWEMRYTETVPDSAAVLTCEFEIKEKSLSTSQKKFNHEIFLLSATQNHTILT
jgi:putative endonuclease